MGQLSNFGIISSVKKTAIVIICALSILTTSVVIGILPPESHFLLDPYIDTIFAENFTWEKYDEIRTGMRPEEVMSLVGEPLNKLGTGREIECWRYSRDRIPSWFTWDFSWYRVAVCFKDGLVDYKPVEEIFD